ncbi:LicD family protein [Halomonas binhaiensis]|uniref:LicD family protein n=1 Tax=Halomonas binhaiensis TaxID=2562282 RepID=A0A5C1NCT7_9GAMM|nr:LicD family protein [Halomonas binhaiensis]QEM80770.1 LicD family protein [Halomonas binhaiensis]
MRLEVQKTYKILRFLNKPRSLPVRSLYSVSCWCGMLLLGAPLRVANDSFCLAAKPNGIIIVVRRMIWFINTGWIPVSIPADYFFDISEKMSLSASRSLIEWLGRNNRIDEFGRCIWQADLIGGIIERKCDAQGRLELTPANAVTVEDNLFCQKVDGALGALCEYSKVIPDNKTVTKKFKKRKESFDKRDAYQAISDFRRLMSELEFPWYVVSGTLLGAVRNKDFLDHDYDIDVGIDYDDFDTERFLELANGSAERAWVVKSTSYCTFREKSESGSVVYYQMEKPILIKLVHKSGLVIDVFIHIKDGENIWHGSPIHRWDNTLFEITEYRLGEEVVFGAKDADRYLTENYGDWKTPVVEFDCSIDPPNIRYSNTVKSVTYLSKVAYRFLQCGEIEKSSIYLESMQRSGAIIRDKGTWKYNR